MIQIINQPENVVEDMLSVLPDIYPKLKYKKETGIVYRTNLTKDCVPLLSGGGSGHEPAHFGYVGQGMLSCAVEGPIFVPPSAEHILEGIKTVYNAKTGLLVIIKNFEEDVTNFGSAIRQAREMGMNVEYVISHDDISIESSSFTRRQRGVAGTVLMHKILGAAAQAKVDLDGLVYMGNQISECIATLGVASRAATLPGKTEPMFELDDHDISYGIGIHGEQGYRTIGFESSEKLAVELVNKLNLKSHWHTHDPYIVLVNNLGGCTREEELIFTHDILQLLDLEGLNIIDVKIGTFMTSLNMAGLSVTLFKLHDPSWLAYYQAPTDAFAW